MSAFFFLLLSAGTLAAADPPAPVATYNNLNLGLVLTLERSPLVLGIDQEVMLRVSLPDDAVGEMGKVTLRTTVGEIIDVARDNSRTMSARWVLPARRFPQGAIVMATSDDPTPHMAVMCVPLAAVASPAFHTDPGAEVSVRVAGRMFGPKRANAAGDIRVPVVVPPGVDLAVALSRNEHGKTAEETLNLGHPPFQRMTIWAPMSARFGMPTEVWAFGIDDAARPLAPGMISLKWQSKTEAQAGEVWAQPISEGPGWTQFLVIPPNKGPGDTLVLKAFDQAAKTPTKLEEVPIARAETELPLVAGSPTRFVMLPNRIHMTVGSTQRTVVVVRAEDAFGNPTSAEQAKLYVDGKAAGNVEQLGGPVRIVVAAPRESVRPDRMLIEAVGIGTYAVHEIVLNGTARPPAPREIYVGLEHHSALNLKTAVVWNPEAAMGIGVWMDGELALRKLAYWPRNLFVSASAGYVQRSKIFLSADSLERLTIHVVPLVLGARWRTSPARGISVLVGAAAGAARIDTTTTTLGDVSSGTAWVPALRVSADVALGQGPFQLVIGLSHLQLSGAQLSSQDSLKGNLGGWEAGIGGRRRW